jgi:hypothetical protein
MAAKGDESKPVIMDQPHQGENERWTAGSIRTRGEKRSEVRKRGRVQHDADHEWITFSRVMSKAIDTQKNATQNQQQSSSQPHMALQRMVWGPGGASNREDARQHATCATVSNARTKAMQIAHAMYLYSAYHSTARRR